MKKVILFLCLSSTVFFTSCSKDDDSNTLEADQSLIPGTWNVTSIKVTNGHSTTSVGDQTIVSADYTTEGKDFDMQIVFKNDTEPNTYTSSGGYTAVITTTTLGQTTTQEETTQGFIGEGESEGEWSFESPNKIVFANDNYKDEFIITVLDESTMKMEHNIDRTIENDFIGATIHTSGTLFIELNKS